MPVLAVMGDSHAALFAHAGWRPGLVKATYGTGSSVMAASRAGAGQAPGCARRRLAGRRRPVHALEGNIRSSGATLAWLAELSGTTPAELAARRPTECSDGVHLVPAFGGLGAPWWDDDAAAC